MPNIVVCYKWVIDEADVRVESGGSLNLERAARKISEYDRNAIEAAAQLHEQHGGDCVAVSLGGPEVQNSAKEALARGPERAVLAVDPAFENADARITAHGLAAAIRQAGPFDLILCGEGSGDQYNQQVGPRIAALLDIPCITFVSKLELTEGGVRAERKLEDGVEVVEAAFPVVVTVMPDLNKPRIPGLKQVMGARKKEVRTFDAAALGLGEAQLAARADVRSLRAPASNRRQVKVGSVEELADAIAAAVR